MNAKLLLDQRHTLSEISFVEMVVWRLPSPLSGSRHGFKYRLALVVDGRCVLRYDIPYSFTTPQALLDDFWNEVNNWRP